MANAGLLNPFGNGGRTDNSAYYSNLDKNLYLSASDMGKTVTISQSNGYGVILPDARQLTKNVIVNIVNRSTTAISVYNNNSLILKVIPVGKQIICWCSVKTTSGGIWAVTIVGTSNNTSVGVGSTVQVNSANGLFNSVCLLSSTVAITTCYNGATAHQVSVLTLSGNAITVGTTASITTANAVASCLSAIDSTRAVFVWTANSSYVYGLIISYNGSTITLGTQATIMTGISSSWISVCALSTSTFITSSLQGLSYLGVVSSTFSGTTISSSTAIAYAFSAATQGYMSTYSLAAINTTTAVLCARYNNAFDVWLLTNASPVTISSPLAISGGFGSFNSICVLSSTNALICYSDGATNNPINVVLITISPSLTQVAATAVNIIVGAVNPCFSMCKMSPTSVMLLYTDVSNNMYGTLVTVSGTTITVGNTAFITTHSYNINGICNLTSTTALITYTANPNSYQFASILMLS